MLKWPGSREAVEADTTAARASKATMQLQLLWTLAWIYGWSMLFLLKGPRSYPELEASQCVCLSKAVRGQLTDSPPRSQWNPRHLSTLPARKGVTFCSLLPSCGCTMDLPPSPPKEGFLKFPHKNISQKRMYFRLQKYLHHTEYHKRLVFQHPTSREGWGEGSAGKLQI